MISLELPHISVLSKVDLVLDRKRLNKFLNLEYGERYVDLDDESHLEQMKMNKGEVEIDDYDQRTKFDQKYEIMTQKIKEIVNFFLI